MSKDAGGSEFPHKETSFSLGSTGMTLRDYFAAKAMQGLLSSGYYHGMVDLMPLAFSSYEVASAMLDERGKND